MKKIVALIALLVIGAAGIAWNAARCRLESETDRVVVVGKRRALEAEIARAEEQLTGAKRIAGNLRAALDESRRTTGNAKPVVSPPKPMATSLAQFAEWVKEKHEKRVADAKDPAAQLRSMAYTRACSSMEYATLFKKQGFSSEQVDKFLTLKADYRSELADLQSLIDEGAVAKDDPVVAEFKKQKLAEYNAAMRDLSGSEAATQQLLEYERSVGARYIVGGMAGTATVAGAPLAAGQLEQLVQILSNNCRGYQRGGDTWGEVEWGDNIDWKAVDVQARPILSDAQFTAFTKFDGSQTFGSRFVSQIWSAHTSATKAIAETRPPGP
jgi:hypothetical protein